MAVSFPVDFHPAMQGRSQGKRLDGQTQQAGGYRAPLPRRNVKGCVRPNGFCVCKSTPIMGLEGKITS